MSTHYWKIQLHLTSAVELRSMARKMVGENGKAELMRMAEDHEQMARSLEGTVISDPKRPTKTA